MRWLGSNGDWARLEVAARFVKTRGEAVAAVLAGTSCMPRGVEDSIERWLDVIRLHGISPPAEQPSAVEELERIASVMESSLGHRKSTNLSEWQQGFEASERSTIEGLRVRALQLKETA